MNFRKPEHDAWPLILLENLICSNKLDLERHRNHSITVPRGLIRLPRRLKAATAPPLPPCSSLHDSRALCWATCDGHVTNTVLQHWFPGHFNHTTTSFLACDQYHRLGKGSWQLTIMIVQMVMEHFIHTSLVFARLELSIWITLNLGDCFLYSTIQVYKFPLFHVYPWKHFWVLQVINFNCKIH